MSNELKKSFLERTRLAIRQNQSLEFLPDWLCDNTAHPTKAATKWSFEGHEFQREILSSTAHKQSTRKCSQVGLSEVSARKALALAALRQGVQIIYTLPSGSFAQMFAKTRLDPIIDNSPTLSALADPDANNTKLKKIGSSFLHFVGTYSASSPISIPASYVISDEVDFSNQEILSEFASRMGHQKESESASMDFSTPTVDGYAISESYSKSSQGVYAVKCEKCEQWQMPKFLDDVIIPSSDVPVNEITKFDVETLGKEGVMGAYLQCPNPKCKHDLTNSLLNTDRRKWIHAYPDKRRDHEGFQVYPFDVPTINPVGRTLWQIREYKKQGSWYNFKLGETYSDESSRFDIDQVTRSTKLTQKEGVYGAVMGIDVGKKQTWVSVGVPFNSYVTGDVDSLAIVDLIVLDSTEGDTTLGERVLSIAHKYSVTILVCDAAPDFSTAQYLTRTLLTGLAFGNYYVPAKTFDKELGHWRTDERKGVCLSDRTRSIDELCALNNSGSISYPMSPEMERVKAHLDAVKRIDPEDDEARWVKRASADDHWVHSLNYLLLASQIRGGAGVGSALALAPSIKTVTLKGGKPIKM